MGEPLEYKQTGLIFSLWVRADAMRYLYKEKNACIHSWQ